MGMMRMGKMSRDECAQCAVLRGAPAYLVVPGGEGQCSLARYIHCVDLVLSEGEESDEHSDGVGASFVCSDHQRCPATMELLARWVGHGLAAGIPRAHDARARHRVRPGRE